MRTYSLHITTCVELSEVPELHECLVFCDHGVPSVCRGRYASGSRVLEVSHKCT